MNRVWKRSEKLSLNEKSKNGLIDPNDVWVLKKSNLYRLTPLNMIAT